MEWYYAVGEEQRGPISEEAFQQLVQQGVVTGQTLVWREGMAGWQAYSGIAVPPRLAAHPAVAGVKCQGCQGVFPAGEVVTLAGAQYCAACKPLAVQRLKEGVVNTSSEAERIRNEHLKHEASLQSVGLLYYLGGVFVVLAGIAMVVAALGDGSANGDRRQGLSAALGLFFFAVGVVQFWTGRGLRRLQPWARIPSGILSGFGLLGFPIGTLINAYILYLLFSEKGRTVFSPEYRVVMEQTPHIKYRTSVIVWILLGLVLALIAFGLIAALIGGSRRH